MNLKAKIARTLFLLMLGMLSMIGAAWRYSATQAQQYPESQIELRSATAPQVGQPYIVDVYANVAAPAYGFGAQITYDPAVLQLELQRDNDGTLVPLRVGGVFGSAQRIRNNQASEGTSATLDAVYTLLPPAQPAQGEGFIGRLTFTVLQDAPAQIELVSPRLIALDNGVAVDLPVVMGAPLLLNQQAEALSAEVVEQPVVQVVETAPIPAAQPVAQSVLATVDTPRDILEQMNRTSMIMNAVAIGLLVMMGLMLTVMTISTFIDALETAKAGRSMNRSYAYAVRVPAQPQLARPQRQVIDSYRAPETLTLPSRSEQMKRLMATSRRRGPETNDL
jgi:hypothetical protein